MARFSIADRDTSPVRQTRSVANADVTATATPAPAPSLTKPSGTTVSPTGSLTAPAPSFTAQAPVTPTGGGGFIAGSFPSFPPATQGAMASFGAPGGGVAQGAAMSGNVGLQEAITAAITAIETQYGLTREQLLADESDIGRQYRLLVLEQNRQGELGTEAALRAGAERGIARSGITAANVADVQRATAENVAMLAANEQRALQANILQQQQAAAALPADMAIAGQFPAEQQLGLDTDAALLAAQG